MMRRLWNQRVAGPMGALLRQGATAEGLALALALGVATGLFPVIGTTTVLGLATAAALRLNLPALQLANWMAYPLQIAMIIPLVRLGEWLSGAPPVSFSVTQVVTRTTSDPLGALSLYGMTGLHGILGWVAIVPLLVLVLYRALLPALRGVQVRVRPRPPGRTPASDRSPLGSEARAR
jgi:uncharacterized protein (DUF2062 family)